MKQSKMPIPTLREIGNQRPSETGFEVSDGLWA